MYRISELCPIPLWSDMFKHRTVAILLPPKGVCAFCDFLVASTTSGERQVMMRAESRRAAHGRAAPLVDTSAATEGTEHGHAT